jgi:excisionase family DNA binding protein
MRESTDLLTVAEVAELLRVKESTVYTWAESGVLPVYRVGRLLRFSRTALDAWLVSRRSGEAWPRAGRVVDSRPST